MHKSQACCFFGNRDSSEKIRSILYAEIEKLIAQHAVTTFYVGGYGNFDRISIAALNEVKRKYPHIEIILVWAYLPTEKKQSTKRIYMAQLYTQTGLKLYLQNLQLHIVTGGLWSNLTI